MKTTDALRARIEGVQESKCDVCVKNNTDCKHYICYWCLMQITMEEGILDTTCGHAIHATCYFGTTGNTLRCGVCRKVDVTFDLHVGGSVIENATVDVPAAPECTCDGQGGVQVTVADGQIQVGFHASTIVHEPHRRHLRPDYQVLSQPEEANFSGSRALTEGPLVHQGSDDYLRLTPFQLALAFHTNRQNSPQIDDEDDIDMPGLDEAPPVTLPPDTRARGDGFPPIRPDERHFYYPQQLIDRPRFVTEEHVSARTGVWPTFATPEGQRWFDMSTDRVFQYLMQNIIRDAMAQGNTALVVGAQMRLDEYMNSNARRLALESYRSPAAESANQAGLTDVIAAQNERRRAERVTAGNAWRVTGNRTDTTSRRGRWR